MTIHPFTWCSLGLLAAAPAQQIPHATLMIRCPVGDVVLNKPLVDALLAERECKAAAQQAVDASLQVGAITCEIPVAHLPGTFQVHLDAAVVPIPKEEQRQKLVDAVVAHLHARLEAMLFEQPRERLVARRAELQHHHVELQVRLAELRSRIDAAKEQRQLCRQRQHEAQTLLAAAELEIAVEERVREHLEQLRKRQEAEREGMRQRINKLYGDKSPLDEKLRILSMQIRESTGDNGKATAAKLQGEVTAIESSIRDLTQALDAANQQAQDAQRMATVVLDQLPANALALQRARARAEVLRAAARDTAAAYDVATKAHLDAARLEAEAEHVGVDVAVAKTMLLEIEGKLAALQPLQLTLIRAPAGLSAAREAPVHLPRTIGFGSSLPAGTKRIDTLLTQCRVFFAVMRSPSNTCPRWPLQLLQTISVRTMPRLESLWRSTAPGISSSKLGQPQPEWNLSFAR
jgi:hypothetical protein